MRNLAGSAPETPDDIDFAFGGVVGCDGAFSTARDLATLAQALLDDGVSASGARLFAHHDVEQMTSNQTPWADMATAEKGWMETVIAGPKSIGWELVTRSSYTGALSPRTISKGGIVGTFVVIDPASDLIVVYLTNRGVPASGELAKWYADVAPAEVLAKIGAAVGRGGG